MSDVTMFYVYEITGYQDQFDRLIAPVPMTVEQAEQVHRELLKVPDSMTEYPAKEIVCYKATLNQILWAAERANKFDEVYGQLSGDAYQERWDNFTAEYGNAPEPIRA